METFNLVESWLDNVAYSHSKNKNTPDQYRRGLNAFCTFIGATPEQIKEEYDKIDEKVFKKKHSEYLRAFISHLSKKDAAPNTIHDTINAVKSFFKYNDLPLAFIPAGKRQVRYHNRDITKEEINAILDIVSPRDKAFFSMMAQSGIRPETLCNLRIKHIEPDFSKGVIPCKVTIPQELAKGQYHAYFTFIGKESANYLKAYLATRKNTTPEDYLFTKMGVENVHAHSKSMSTIFMSAVRKLRAKGIVNYELRKGKPAELRLYNLRKYFNKHAGQMGSEEKEFLMGHSQGVRDHYLAQDPEHYRKLYAEKAMPFLRFETATPSEFEKAITERDQEIATLKDEMKTLKELVIRLTEKQEEINEQLRRKNQGT
jgi:integrase